MDLYLIRHAHAVDGDGMRDDDRPLSREGRRQARDVGAALARQKVALARIVTSPLVRAVETAEIVALALGFDGGLGVADDMRPDGSFKRLLREVIEPASDGALALVGHEPSIGQFLSKLLHERGLSMSKGAVVRLQFAHAEEPAKLVWTISPKRLEPSAGL